MNWMEQGISFEAKMGDGSEADKGLMGKLFSAGKRALTGVSLFNHPLYQPCTRQKKSGLFRTLPRKNYPR